MRRIIVFLLIINSVNSFGQEGRCVDYVKKFEPNPGVMFLDSLENLWTPDQISQLRGE